MAAMAGSAAGRAAVAQALRELAGRTGPEAARALEAAVAAAATRHPAPEGQGDAPAGRFDRAIDMVNRLPRPVLAFGTVGLFVYAIAAPDEFGQRMAALAAVPEPMWWLIGAVVSLHFGAREAHHFRDRGASQGALSVAGQDGAGTGPRPGAAAAPGQPAGPR
ncbi:MAG: methionine synthase I [Rhodobacteraceae bacterium]|jgi:hypothetical protein|nr:methionine synthase I [Paracoccaceae bacterium]